MQEKQLFSESEVAEIIRRAGELQEEKSHEGYVPGIDSNELNQLALEVGIRPEYLQMALRERTAPSQKSIELTDKVERVLPVEIDPEEYDVITDNITLAPMQTYNGVTGGGVSQFGRTLTGQAKETWGNPHFKINSRGGRTKVEVWTDRSIPLALGFLWTLPAILTVPVAFKLAGPLLGFITLALIIFGIVSTYRGALKKCRIAVRDVADKLEKTILEYGAERSSKLESNLAKAPETSVISESQLDSNS